MNKAAELLMEYRFGTSSDVVEFMTRNNISAKDMAEIMSQSASCIRLYMRAYKLGVDIKLQKKRRKVVNPEIDKLMKLQLDIANHIRKLRRGKHNL